MKKLLASALLALASVGLYAESTVGKTELYSGKGTGKVLSTHDTPALDSPCIAAAKTKAIGTYRCEVAIVNKATPAPPTDSWVRCATEGGTCALTGMQKIRYGTSPTEPGKFFERAALVPTACTNAVFGDPAVTVLKSCWASVLAGGSAPPVGGARDPLKEPFASSSIWNTAIGSSATYVDAQMTHIFADVWASMPYADEDVIIQRPTAPATPIRQGNWDGDRCPPISGTVYATVPVPSDYLNPSSNNNMATGILAADGRTIVNVQPFTRCTAGQPATAIVRWPDSDLYGDGIDGAHGGSGMSSVGGTLRVGELRPGSSTGPNHALKLVVYMREGHRCTTIADCYRWPAKAADGYAVGWYGADRAGPTGFKMGALLALQPSVNIDAIGLETDPGRQIAWTLQNYGGYVADDSYGGQFGITTERGPDGVFVSQFQADFGYAFHARQNATGPQAAWMRDIQRIVDRLHIVDNNSVSTVGGGGTPRVPTKPAISP